eukprot:m.479739 g.479739  ORF g.479739 m.479739 type:complete len:388 (+) comp21581_c0_seq1:683-1846(+)
MSYLVPSATVMIPTPVTTSAIRRASLTSLRKASQPLQPCNLYALAWIPETPVLLQQVGATTPNTSTRLTGRVAGQSWSMSGKKKSAPHCSSPAALKPVINWPSGQALPKPSRNVSLSSAQSTPVLVTAVTTCPAGHSATGTRLSVQVSAPLPSNPDTALPAGQPWSRSTAASQSTPLAENPLMKSPSLLHVPPVTSWPVHCALPLASSPTNALPLSQASPGASTLVHSGTPTPVKLETTLPSAQLAPWTLVRNESKMSILSSREIAPSTMVLSDTESAPRLNMTFSGALMLTTLPFLEISPSSALNRDSAAIKRVRRSDTRASLVPPIVESKMSAGVLRVSCPSSSATISCACASGPDATASSTANATQQRNIMMVCCCGCCCCCCT